MIIMSIILPLSSLPLSFLTSSVKLQCVSWIIPSSFPAISEIAVIQKPKFSAMWCHVHVVELNSQAKLLESEHIRTTWQSFLPRTEGIWDSFEAICAHVWKAESLWGNRTGWRQRNHQKSCWMIWLDGEYVMYDDKMTDNMNLNKSDTMIYDSMVFHTEANRAAALCMLNMHGI